MVKWVIQNNLGNSEDIGKLMSMLQTCQIPFETIKVIPFSDDPPDVDNSQPTIFYGSTTLTRNVHEAQRWNPGVWFNPESYEFERVLAGYGKEHLLNGDSEVLTVKELLSRNYKNNELLFVRPAADMKEFTGSVMDFEEIKQWSCLEGTNGPFTFDTKVQVAEPKNIDREFRTIVVDKRVITASQYRLRGRLEVRGEVPEEALLYASAVAQLYQPAPVFVLDVCELSSGLYKIVETNTFNAAGFYWCDYHKIVTEVTDYTKSHYQ